MGKSFPSVSLDSISMLVILNEVLEKCAVPSLAMCVFSLVGGEWYHVLCPKGSNCFPLLLSRRCPPSLVI